MNKATEFTRVYTLAMLGQMADDAFELQRARLVDHYYKGNWEAFKEATANGLGDIPMPPRGDLQELITLIRDTSPVPYDLGYEDKQYLAEVRTFLVDALMGCIDGDVDVAADQLEKANTKLYWITYERKRQDKRDFHNPFAVMRPTFEQLTKRSGQLARRFGQVSVSA